MNPEWFIVIPASDCSMLGNVSISLFSDAILVILMYLELLDYCLISLKFGPKVMMIIEMLFEMVYFLPFFAIFLLGFGVAEQVTLYPNRNRMTLNVTDAGTMVQLAFSIPLYRVFGENALDEAQGQLAHVGALRQGGATTVSPPSLFLSISKYSTGV